MGPVYPTLVVQRQSALTFEQRLREVMHDAPYLGIALLVHLCVLLLVANMSRPVQEPGKENIIRASPFEATVPLPPPPPPVSKPLDLPDDPLIEPIPTVSEDPPALDDFNESPMTEDWSLASVSPLGIASGRLIGGRDGGLGDGIRSGPPPAITDDAVRSALLWLKRHQSRDGGWSASAFDDMCATDGDVCDGTGSPRFDVGVSGLALLAFLGAGNTDQSGLFQSTVKNGLRFLKDIQEADGSMAPRNSSQGTYDHVIATLALCEAYTHSPASFHLKRPATEALHALYAMRTPGSGWRYTADHPEMLIPGRAADTSVTGWAVLTMAAARKARLPFDQDAWDDALAFLDSMTDPITGRTGYIQPGGPSSREIGTATRWPAEQTEAMTAVGLLCRVFDDPDLERPGNKLLVEKATAVLAAQPPTWSDEEPGRRDYYYWYYGAYALYQVGGPSWRAWERALLDSALGHQQQTGDSRGSWDPQEDPWGHAGGRVYSTAITTLTLEVYYRYDRLLGSGR